MTDVIWKTAICDGCIWADYRVSSKGEIRNIRTDRDIKSVLTSQGYFQVTLCEKGYQKVAKVHRIVASSFLGNNPTLYVNHRDGNKTNNAVENLEWVTAEQNAKHASATGLMKPASGNSHPHSRLTQKEVEAIKHVFYYSDISNIVLGSHFGVSRTTIRDIRQEKTWKSVAAVDNPDSKNLLEYLKVKQQERDAYLRSENENRFVINAKLSIENIREIKELLKQNNFTQEEIGKRFSVSSQTISNINTGYRWSSVA